MTLHRGWCQMMCMSDDKTPAYHLGIDARSFQLHLT